ncbi:AAA family ATPase [Bradyrhizobium japonicum]|uniref:AAA family ATPase n=1 Tax=Bradyrhizobium japonicum TaxID=375 RepID=UPI00271497F3|nr:AAA family ATPase [Bradyrhizobium japonicum]WLB54831.1 AAA family ATPase [Bradyrhizobium japonicum]WLB63294.1 AAA family ATPase [Bradyrhizobium japonicum]
MTDQEKVADVPPSDEASSAERWSVRPNASRCLADAALDAALTQEVRLRLKGEEALAIVVRVPGPSWVVPIESAIKRLNERVRTVARDGANRAGHKPDVGNGDVARQLAKGETVVGIAALTAVLPRSLTAAADLTVEIGFDAEVLGAAVARFTGSAPAPERIECLGALDFDDLVSGFRAGSGAADIAARVRRTARRLASPREDKLPKLEDAIEYGGARERGLSPREWGLSVGHEFARFRKNEIPWNEARACANALFGGPPGLGKTYFARILANHLGVPLISASISEIFATSAGYLDSVIKGVRDVFARAEATAPSAILWDEFDSLPSRENLSIDNSRSSASSWWTPVIAEFLLQLDSAVGGRRRAVFVWAASNHPDRIDPALLRPGRLDRVIHFRAPDAEGVASIARHHLGSELPGADLTAIGQLGLGRSPAEIAAAVSSARRAARTAKRPLRYDDLVDALAPRPDVDDATLRRIARHEAGHVVTAIALGVDELVAVDVVGDAGAFGRTVLRQRPGIDTRATIEKRAVYQLGGRAAEFEIYGGDCAANAGGDLSSDLALATAAATALRISLGLGGELTYLGGLDAASDLLRTDPGLRAAVGRDLARLHGRAVDIVRRHRAALDATAAALLDRRHLTGDEARSIFARQPPRPE